MNYPAANFGALTCGAMYCHLTTITCFVTIGGKIRDEIQERRV